MRRLALLLLLGGTVLAAGPEKGKVVENVAARADATQTYTLYLPPSHTAASKLPLLLIFDPRGRGTTAAEIFRPAAEQYGWILMSSNQTRSDGEAGVNERAIRALLPETTRWSADPKRLYATGFSGTAIVACALGLNSGALAGVIGVGGRLVKEVPPADFRFAHFGAAGDTDFNNREMRELDDALGRAGKPHRFEQFSGDHRWFDSALATDAVAWMELVAMKEERRARDEALIERLYARDLEAADALGESLDALRRHRNIVHTFHGLHAVDVSRAAIERLERSRIVLRSIDEEKAADELERRYVSDVFARLGTLLAQLRSDTPTKLRAAEAFRLRDLQRRAKREGAEGRSAQRLLEMVYAQASFYLTRQLFERKEYRVAAAVLGVATEIHPDRWPPWYNLAAAHARLGERREAVRALDRAFAAGFHDLDQLARDEDFSAVRNDPGYLKLLASHSQ